MILFYLLPNYHPYQYYSNHNLYDMLDVYPEKKPKFAKNFLAGSSSIKDAIKKYVEEVKNGTFPDENYSY